MKPENILQRWQAESEASGVGHVEYLSGLVTAEPSSLGEVAACLGISAVDPETLRTAPTRFDLLPLHDALTLRVLPVEIDGEPSIVVADPFARHVRDELLARFGAQPVCVAMSVPGEVERLLADVESNERLMDGMTIDAQGDSLAQAIESISLASIAKDESPIIRLVNTTLYDALQCRASDIHLEAVPDGLSIRYRIDGVLQSIRHIPGLEAAAQTMSRLKVLSTLDIAEKRVPQDGRFKVVLQGREIDFRVSIIPGTYGENAVMRVLDKSQRGDDVSLDVLGFDAHTARRVRTLAHLPYGLMLVTGPTGSGKSTTLYAVLSEVNTGDDKIITIEDPVEYELKGVLQIPVNERKGLTFARGLRSILRHDPDTVMVGEIRDEETASIAVQSALTGHRVLSTVHANDGFSVIDRFIYMGVEPSTFLEALNGVVSQRLVRRICTRCGGAQAGGADLTDAPLAELKQAVGPGPGCEACRGTGYHGRIGLAEVLTLDAQIKAALLERSIEKRARALENSVDYQSIRDAGLAAIRARQTTFQEVQRAIALE
ncbi:MULTISPECIES: GspE/PulE family protein [Cupriavidus]|uniref:GspE/PulE family protein n=1 Tax=Cupriavidus TaxID=106589 RepID=UPI0016031ADF|nr:MULTISPECIES: GspE/PulE family protein [Cupriavidus]MBB1634733.1 type II secretion system protein E [Cupriavidus sp. UME77]MDR3382930.1 GspE/PulE family protein [Cupriavidus basilensis]MDR3386745.1 GspE/PulE family protein [Rudaea sp.]